MNVLSLFDGCSGGQMALDYLGVQVDNYYAAEIDKWAIKVTMNNYPNTIQLGDVTKVSAHSLPPIHFLCGGSPCQGFSFAGKGLNFYDSRSKLFFEFVRILKEVREINPDVLFLLENVRMKKEHEEVISRLLEIQPININSELVSAQSRERLYWTNIYTQKAGLFGDAVCLIPQPKDRGILLKHILQPPEEVDEKYYISEKALARILRKEYSNPKLNPDKTGAINTKNNSGQPSVDSGTTLVDFLNFNGELREVPDGKSLCIDANYFKGPDNHGQRTTDRYTRIDIHGNISDNQDKSGCFTAGAHSGGNHSDMDLIVYKREIIQLNPSKESGGIQPYQQNRIYHPEGISPPPLAEMSSRTHAIVEPDAKTPQGQRVYGTDGKAVTQSASDGGWGAGTGLYVLNTLRIRRLTPIEVERLFNIPDNYTSIVSDSQRYKILGNGWSRDVIVHILSFANFKKKDSL